MNIDIIEVVAEQEMLLSQEREAVEIIEETAVDESARFLMDQRRQTNIGTNRTSYSAVTSSYAGPAKETDFDSGNSTALLESKDS